MLGIVVAMDVEAAPFLRRGFAFEDSAGGRRFYGITVGGKEAVLAVCGVGKVNAAYSTALLLERYKPDIVINCGVSGGLKPNLRALDLVAATAAVQHDADTSALGDPKGYVSTVGLIYFPADEELTDKAAAFCAVKGIAASGEQFVADERKKRFIAEEFGACVCDMESGAVAQCAYIAGKRFACIRCVSDPADASAASDFAEFAEAASDKLFLAVENLAFSLTDGAGFRRNYYL